MFPVASVYEEMSTRIPGMKFESEEEELERGKISANELAILGKYSSFSDLATMDFSSEITNSSSESTASSANTSRLWRELLY